MIALITFLVILSVIVLIHELGHYFAARIFGVKADEFGYGFPPRLIGVVRHKGKWKIIRRKDEDVYEHTIWSLNWLPLGGFVRIKGEQPDDSFKDNDSKDNDSFQTKPIWKRIIILSAGVAMNWFLAFILFATIFTVGAPAFLEGVPAEAKILNHEIRISNLLPGSPAEQAGLQAGDQILNIAGFVPENYEQAINKIGEQGTNPFDIQIKRGDIEQTINVTPVYLKEIDKPGIGIALADVGIVRFGFFQALRQAMLATYNYTSAVIIAFGTMLRDLLFLHGLEQDVTGPVGIAVMAGQFAKQGIMPVLQFAAILSINLAVINFLPIPALDGGRVLFLVIEKVRRKAIRPKLEATIHQIAFLSLIILILLVTIRDVGRFGGVIIGGVRHLIGV